MPLQKMQHDDHASQKYMLKFPVYIKQTEQSGENSCIW